MQPLNRLAATCFLMGCLLALLLTNVVGQDLFKEPQSAEFDSTTNRYFISNADDGKIIVISPDGEQSVYNEALSSCRGLHITDSLLYGAGAEGIVVIDLLTDEQKDLIEIEGRTFLTDVTSDTSGFLYVTDSSQGKIYKIRKSDYSYTEFATGLTGIKGVLFIKELNILYYVTGRDIKRVSLVDSTVTDIIRTYHSQLQGLAVDTLGYVYFSSWGSDGVFRYDPWFSLYEADTVSVGHTDPADIYYNVRDNVLVVPNYNANTVDFVPNVCTAIPPGPKKNNGFALTQNYPNPFNPVTTLKFTIPVWEHVRIAVYNLRGEQVEMLIDRDYPAGTYSAAWNAEQCPSGIYFYKITAGQYSETRKMLLVR